MPKLRTNPLRERIRGRLTDLGISPIDAATSVGLERNYLRDLLDGRKEGIGQRAMPQVAKALNWSVAQLMGEASEINHRRDIYESEGLSERQPSSVIPEYDLHAGAGYGGGFSREETSIDQHGEISRDAIRAEWHVPSAFLRDELRVRKDRVHILPIKGDSMVDTLFDGDRALLDLDDTDVSQGGIFALVDDTGSVIIKQVELLHGKRGEARRIKCTSRNPRYEPFELALQEPVKIIGRVACRITRL